MFCKNCDNKLKETQKFCDECGAKVIENRLTPKVLAHQVNEEFISIDNKLFRTFIDLFKRPENVIVGYIDGTRKKYIDVIQYFAIALTLAGIQVFLMTTFFEESLDFGSGFAEGYNAASAQKNNPLQGFDNDIFTKYQGLIYIISTPFAALGTWLTYYLLGIRRYNFTEHLVINLYYNAQIIIVTAVLSILFLVLGINYLIISTLLVLPMFAYLFYLLKRIFKKNFIQTLWAFIMVMMIYSISFLIAFIGIIAIISVIILSIT